MDWTQVLSPITNQLEGHMTLAVAGVVALVAAPLLFKGGIAVASYAARRLQTIFGG